MKRILLCCGTGVATSTVVNKKLEQELIKRGYRGQFTITQCKAAEVRGKASNFDICVSTVPLSFSCDIPIVVATGLIINRGTQEIYDNIVKLLFAE